MRPIGYAHLLQHYSLNLPKLEVEYYQGDHPSGIRTVDYGAGKRKLVSRRTKIGNRPFDHLAAAIEYQGIRLAYLYAVFAAMDPKELAAAVSEKPHSQIGRVIWHLYEWLLRTKLDLPDLTSGNYIPLFDPRYYFVRTAGDRCSRTRIIHNAIGTADFCPTVRKVAGVRALCDVDVYQSAYVQFQEKIQALKIPINANVVDRCINYLYTKESKTSSEIEREKPDQRRLKRFNQALKNAGLYSLSKSTLIHIQNQIVDEKVQVSGYRTEEIYVGETRQFRSFRDEQVHFVGPMARHVEDMMAGLLKTHDYLMVDSDMPPLMHATVISFGLVYIHPFDDGNGRTHRYLLHDVFKQRDKRHEFIIPISATILKNEKEYDRVLNTVSIPIMQLLSYDIDPDQGNALIIHSDLHYLYRYPDFTPHVQFIYQMMDTSVKLDLLDELLYLMLFDALKTLLHRSADVKSNHADTIVNIIINNGGKVSERKRTYVLSQITQEVVALLESEAARLLKLIKRRTGIDLMKVKFD